jgi:hypothetical protein
MEYGNKIGMINNLFSQVKVETQHVISENQALISEKQELLIENQVSTLKVQHGMKSNQIHEEKRKTLHEDMLNRNQKYLQLEGHHQQLISGNLILLTEKE